MNNSVRDESRLDVSLPVGHVPSVNRLSPSGPGAASRLRSEKAKAANPENDP